MLKKIKRKGSSKKMQIESSDNVNNLLKGKYIFLDCNFLGKLFKNEELLHFFIPKTQGGYLVSDPFITMEFLRDEFKPKFRENRKQFIFNDKVFLQLPNHQELFIGLQQNALLISRIYKYISSTDNIGAACKPSMVDLILAARLMYHYKFSILITGNNKDYSEALFDLKSTLAVKEDNGQLLNYGMYSFNNEKFNSTLKRINSLPKE